MTLAVSSFRARLREAVDRPTILRELERAVTTAAEPRSVCLWGDRSLAEDWTGELAAPPFDVQDPLADYLLRHSGPCDVDHVTAVSATLEALRSHDARLLVPLVSLGVFVGLLVLGPPSGASSYSAEHMAALEEIATQGAAALRIARLTQQHEASERAWQSNAEELRVAQLIQRSLLPEELPAVPGWRVDAHYQPARVVGGDLYDFIPLPGDLLGLLLGDASDKSVPAALVMASARTLLRAAAQRLVLPSQVLARANDDLCAQIPPGMFVTCFFAILDAATGRLRFANAGHLPPFLHTGDEVRELRASGWPLGLMPGATYDESEVTIAPGSALISFSDGVTETHAPDGAMFGASRIAAALASSPPDVPLIASVLREHAAFAGPEWDQEDDVTLVSLAREATSGPPPAAGAGRHP